MDRQVSNYKKLGGFGSENSLLITFVDMYCSSNDVCFMSNRRRIGSVEILLITLH